MKTHVRALVVGGGAVGTGIAYHLAKAGWDTMLLERDELTSGSTWHAAGLLPLFNMGYATSHIHDYSVRFYKGLEAETGLNPGFAVVGNLRMAQTRADGRVPAVFGHRRDGWDRARVPDARRDQGPLAAGADRGSCGRAVPSDGRLHQPRRRDAGDGQGRAAARGEIVRRVQVDGYRWTGRTGSCPA
jgi:dimethylglycine dehydrogenase